MHALCLVVVHTDQSIAQYPAALTWESKPFTCIPNSYFGEHCRDFQKNFWKLMDKINNVENFHWILLNYYASAVQCSSWAVHITCGKCARSSDETIKLFKITYTTCETKIIHAEFTKQWLHACSMQVNIDSIYNMICLTKRVARGGKFIGEMQHHRRSLNVQDKRILDTNVHEVRIQIGTHVELFIQHSIMIACCIFQYRNPDNVR